MVISLGVSTQRGVWVSRGCLPRGCLPGEGASAWGWCLPRGVYPGGGVYTSLNPEADTSLPHCVLGHIPLWTEWQTGVKTLPCPKLRLWAVITCGGNYGISSLKQHSAQFNSFDLCWLQRHNFIIILGLIFANVNVLVNLNNISVASTYFQETTRWDETASGIVIVLWLV